MTFTTKQVTGDGAIELRLKDKSKIDKSTPITSDEALFEMASIKENIINQLLKSVKEASIDCSLHSVSDSKEALQCFSFGNANPNNFAYLPAITEEELDTAARINKVEVSWKAVELKIDGTTYALNKLTNQIYDLDSYKRKNPVQIGTLDIFVNPETKIKNYRIIWI